ncbi:MAG: hypothetical protein HDR03_08310 [Lachnospiraceae bacterium]|nr:hypothetical protein [Lachnospiraceae bacterium]
MDIGGLQCHGCGSTNVEFDPKTRKLVCNTCGNEEYYSRATLNSNGKVAFSRQNAINFFIEGKFDDSRHYAMDVLNISMDNAPALYIMNYCEEFVTKNGGAMKRFFNQVQDVALEYDEVQDLKKLLVASTYRLQDYEEDMIQMIAANMQSDEDAEDLCGFIDQICPYLISKRTSMDYLTENLTDMYKELAGHCNIPKTCFALLKSIETNPDSPYVNGSFYLESKTQYFYDNYVIPIGSIVKEINDPELREKFVSSYGKKCTKFMIDFKKEA